eukprot:FN603706.1.p2 GENE.FN603706.1~~FN603706.1.p2  ORF type:complete len:51 (+),score=16.22 FN603706.1:120-272(+)
MAPIMMYRAVFARGRPRLTSTCRRIVLRKRVLCSFLDDGGGVSTTCFFVS